MKMLKEKTHPTTKLKKKTIHFNGLNAKKPGRITHYKLYLNGIYNYLSSYVVLESKKAMDINHCFFTILFNKSK